MTCRAEDATIPASGIRDALCAIERAERTFVPCQRYISFNLTSPGHWPNVHALCG